MCVQMADLVGDDGRGDQLRVRMLEARARIRTVLLDDGHMGDARIEAQLVAAGFVGAKDVGDVRVGYDRHRLRVVGRFDDHIMHAEALDAAARAVGGRRGRDLARKGGELVGNDADFPRAVAVWEAQNFRRRLILIALPGQNGQFCEKDVTLRGGWLTMRCSGRLARSMAITTQSFVKKFWRSSGIALAAYLGLGLMSLG
jgi:hypothetical protein